MEDKIMCKYCFGNVDVVDVYEVNVYEACKKCDSQAVYCGWGGEYSVNPVKYQGLKIHALWIVSIVYIMST